MELNNLNKFQTPINKDKLPKKVYEDLIEYISTIPFIRHLISHESVRGYAKDRPKDKTGKIIVDLVKPHMLEDMDYFRQTVLFFQKNGKYTNIPPNPNPKGEYALFWKEELRRWEHGLVRESDGEWIPGYLYFYWNYVPIALVAKTGVEHIDSGRTKGKRVQEFPYPWLGDYLYFHYIDQAREAGQHGKLLKTRGVGFSFKMGSISPCNMYIFPGQRNPNFHLASDKTFLIGDKGIFGKIIDPLDWIAEHTPLPRIRLVNSLRSMEVQLGYIDNYGNRKGLLSSVSAISLKDNPDKARGLRGPLIHYEEDGLFKNLEDAWIINRRAVEAGTTTYGFMLAGGTGGVEGASFEGSKKLFYYPETYNIYSVPNVYDKNVNGVVDCSFFWGVYMNRENCYDFTDGEPDVIKALLEVIETRHLVATSSNDPLALTRVKAEEPVTPQEAIMRIEGTLFPVADLSDYLIEIRPMEKRFLASHYVGDLVYDAVEGVKWKPNQDISPIRSLNVEKVNRRGAIEIFELPKYDSNMAITPGRYIAGIDPIDADEGKSLFSILVMDMLTDRIVAEYTGRHPKAEQCYEEALKLCTFYNAQANYESNLKGVYSYFKHKNALHYLADTPEILKDMDLIKPSVSSTKGTRVTKQINGWGRQLQASWMLSKAYVSEDKNKDGEEIERLNLHTLRSIAYIEECIAWNPDGNFDRVSSANMLFILREERLRRMVDLRKRETKRKKTWADSSFFKQNYEKRKEPWKAIQDQEDHESLFKEKETQKSYFKGLQ